MSAKKPKIPYAGTTIDPETSQLEIKRILKKHGIEDVQITSIRGDETVRFMIQRGSRELYFEITPPKLTAQKKTWNIKTGRYENITVSLSAQAWRLTRDYIDAKLKAIEWGLVTVEREFLNQLLVSGRTIGDIIAERLEQDGEILKLEAPAEERRSVEAEVTEKP